MNICTLVLVLAIVSLCPVYSALSQDKAPETLEENTLADGLKAVKEAEGRIDSPDESGSNEGGQDKGALDATDKTQARDGSNAEDLRDKESGDEEAKVDKSRTDTLETTDVTTKEGLPRGDSLRNPEQPRYDSTGMRDPFKPFIKLVDRPTGPSPIVRPPIRRYPLSSFRLAGIIWIGDEPRAMIVDPEANTYFLGVGDKIGNKEGEIIEVRNRGILVQEKTKLENIYGEVKIEVKKSVLAFQN